MAPYTPPDKPWFGLPRWTAFEQPAHHHHDKPTAPDTPAPGQGTTDNNNAYSYINTQLDQYGLGSLAGWAWKEIVAGRDPDQVILDLYGTKEFKQRFPAIFTRQAQGLPPISPGEYVSYENTATQLFRAAGLPRGFWDSPSDFTNLIAGDVSTDELNHRLDLATQAVFASPQSVRDHLQRDYGINTGDLAANFLDPKQAEPLLQQKFLGAQIGAAGDLTGYHSNRSLDDYLASLNVTGQQAQQGFTDLQSKRPLFEGLPGEGADGIGQDQQIAAEFGGDAAAQQAIARRAQARQAQFQQGGAFTSTSGGFAGVGNSGVQ